MVKIKVPATSANIGAGFDCMGLALDIYNEIWADFLDEGFKIETDSFLPNDQTNLVYSTMRQIFDKYGCKKGIYIKQKNNIPVASGLGSSAACLVGGIIAANELLGKPMSENEIINLATHYDGHPDNVVPAVIGGICASIMTKNGVFYSKCPLPAGICVVTATPDFPLLTETARKILPDTYTREDVIFNISHATLTFAALAAGDIQKLKFVDDRIHQPYRIPLIKGYHTIKDELEKNGALSCFVSGAGPTVAAFTYTDFDISVLTVPKNWTLKKCNVLNSGARIL